MPWVTARRRAARRFTPPPASSLTTSACARSKSCRRSRKSRKRSRLSPSRPPRRASGPPTPTPRPNRKPSQPPNPPPPPAQRGKEQPARLQKLLAAAGLGSRREIESWIAAGRLSVRGQVAKLGDRAVPGEEVALDGRPLELGSKSRGRVLIYNKPEGELVT